MRISSIVTIVTILIGFFSVGITVGTFSKQLDIFSQLENTITISKLQQQNAKLENELESLTLLIKSSDPNLEKEELNLTLLLIVNKLESIQDSINTHKFEHEAVKEILSSSNEGTQIVIESQPFEHSLVLVTVPTVITGIFALVAIRMRKTESK